MTTQTTPPIDTSSASPRAVLLAEVERFVEFARDHHPAMDFFAAAMSALAEASDPSSVEAQMGTRLGQLMAAIEAASRG